MVLFKSKILAGIVVLMVFISQATAASNDVCQIMTLDQNSHLMMDTISPITQEMGHSIIAKGFDNPSDATDCCPQDCTCPLGDCASVMLLSFPASGAEIVALQKTSQRVFLITKRYPTALFRPPISL